MKLNRYLTAAIAAVALSSAAFAQTAPAPASIKDVVKGTMKIDFGTKKGEDTSGTLKEGSAKKGSVDTYTTNLTIADLITFQGVVKRQPNLYKKGVGFGDYRIRDNRLQDAQLYYDLNLLIFNKKDSANVAVGKWVGIVPINADNGAYDMAGGTAGNSALRFDVDAVGKLQAFRDPFKGFLYGKSENKESLKEKIWKRVNPDGKVTTIVIKKNDPMRFENLYVAHGPTPNYAGYTVNGEMDFDYEKGNYFVDNLKFTYRDTKTGADVTDIISGTIKWVKDAQYESNGKSSYQFNLVWNAPAPKQDETAVTAATDDETSIFGEDATTKHLGGKITFADTITGTGDNITTTDSSAEYHLDSTGLTREQVMQFTKLWLIAIGPTNDD